MVFPHSGATGSALLPSRCTSRGAQKKKSQARSRSQLTRRDLQSRDKVHLLNYARKGHPSTVSSPVLRLSGSGSHGALSCSQTLHDLFRSPGASPLPHPISNYHCSVSTCVKLQALIHAIVLYRRFDICLSLGRHALLGPRRCPFLFLRFPIRPPATPPIPLSEPYTLPLLPLSPPRPHALAASTLRFISSASALRSAYAADMPHGFHPSSNVAVTYAWLSSISCPKPSVRVSNLTSPDNFPPQYFCCWWVT
jgi:hypothetical protein